MYTFLKRTPFGLFGIKLMRMLVLTATRRAANNRSYSTQQHFAVLALFHAAFYYLQFRVRDVYRQRLPNFIFTLRVVHSRPPI